MSTNRIVLSVALALFIFTSSRPAVAQVFFVDQSLSMEHGNTIRTPGNNRGTTMYELLSQLFAGWTLRAQVVQAVFWSSGIEDSNVSNPQMFSEYFSRTPPQFVDGTELGTALREYQHNFAPTCRHFVLLSDAFPDDGVLFGKMLEEFSESNNLVTVILMPHHKTADEATRYEQVTEAPNMVLQYEYDTEPILERLRTVENEIGANCLTS